jgi:hypothetical protein
MSYDISLYDREFLKNALETGLGDWTNAPAIPREAAESLIALALSVGFIEDDIRQHGSTPDREFTIDTATCLAQLNVFSGELAFSIPYSDRADESIGLCARLAKTVARVHKLGYNDPQSDDDIFQE